ncbi:gamma-glutamylcyclotransferase [Streptoalloteichus tenebrarius]|uniref:gamma-glutamylcyclotransferase n=1 Tax=Streptoalloteichus tenebrarius (strain ATCC 17920 / DSM 40477 / JCM 4838 / CBS 697.72 / NBRC 16177 / NCIMB 11028 / NRRL B-12390 / A12253. 1 / ISP 5477) TaxID=1933 RepID=UPI0020A2E29B|nr:gamma-glutamylcyclotransferase [Streptoalloteichus tenebrarius]
MVAPFVDAEHPADPYPGSVPGHSYVHHGGRGWPLRPDQAACAGWRVGRRDLDDWLAERDAPPVAARVPLLTYGSNRNPAKLTWLREHLGLPGPVVLIRATTYDLAAVWAAGLRARDGQRPATLCARPGAVESHAVWLATPEQVLALDRCEGRGERYRLARVRTGRVVLEDGATVDAPWAYTAASQVRLPLLVDGRPVRCVDIGQSDALALRGEAGPDGLDVSEVDGPPRADEWPDRLFVYGTLQPGAAGWPLLAPFVVGPGRPATLPGVVHDTGRGYPALRLDSDDLVPGQVLTLRDPAAALPRLDRYEGEEFRRVRVRLPDGSVCWTYVWTNLDDLHRMPALPHGWPVT